MASGNYYEGNSVFTSLSSIFGNPTSGNTSESVPVTSDFFGKVEGFMKKEVFGVPIWIWVIIAVAVVLAIYFVVV